MKKTILLALMILLTIPAMSQERKYKKEMKAAIEEMHKADGPGEEMELVESFEAIAEKYPDQWIPSYHAARILITSSFAETDGEKRDAMLEGAKGWTDRAINLVPDESEVHILESLYYIGMMSVDPMTRGQMYYQDALDAIEKGLSLNPENPRAYYMNGMMTLNMPEFMGGGPEAARPIFLEAAEKFKSYSNEDPFWPVWGKDINQDELDRLKE